MAKWPFKDPPNTACFATSHVLDGSPILRVYHDFDGDWQFHGDEAQVCDEASARVVALSSMLDLDNTLGALHDLPYGWLAHRSGPGAEWILEINHPFPVFATDGYYLEDVDWLAQYLADINPPDREERLNLTPGTYVKLVFRFNSETSERADNECERMWVEVIDFDESNETYQGILANTPHHSDSITCGDALCFHPSHIMAIAND